MARFNVLSTIKSEVTKNNEAAVDSTAGGYGRFDENELVWMEGDKTPEQRVPTRVKDSAFERARMEAIDRRAAVMKERYGVDMGGSFRPRTAKEVASIATSCMEFMRVSEESAPKNPAQVRLLNGYIGDLLSNLKTVAGLRVARGIMRQGLGALTRAVGVLPELSSRLLAMDASGSPRNAEEQDKRDRLVDSVEEGQQSLRVWLTSLEVVKEQSSKVGLVDFHGKVVDGLDIAEELVAAVIGLETGSRKGQVRYSMGGYLPATASQEDKEAHSKRLAEAYKKVEATEGLLVREVLSIIDLPKRQRGATLSAKDSAAKAMEAFIASVNEVRSNLTVKGGESIAEMTGKAVSGKGGGMFDTEVEHCERRLAEAPYQPRKTRLLDEDGNPLPVEVGVLPNTGPLNRRHIG